MVGQQPAKFGTLGSLVVDALNLSADLARPRN